MKHSHHIKIGFVVLAFGLCGFFVYRSLYAEFGKISYSNIENTFLNKNLEEKKSSVYKKIEGLLMFRGNPTRNWYGVGPVPTNPEVLWRYPDKRMCSFSHVYGETKEWCGNGWTGEPVVWEREDGITEVIFGAYDGKVHFVNAETGKDTRTPFPTGDLIKGSVTLDPDGYPFLYFGSRDNYLRILDLSTDTPVEIWNKSSLDDKGMWNNDWDSNPVVIDDILYEACENGFFYAFKLNRKVENGVASVAPELLFKKEVYTDELVKNTGSMQSIESSILVVNKVAYMANSGGRIVGFDISQIEMGVAPIVFDFWTGDDTDATLVSDEDGMIYASVEYERFNARSRELGQLIKLDPTKPDPYVWGIPIREKGDSTVGGIWATPALYKNYLYVPTHNGELLAVDMKAGSVAWKDDVGFHAWGSPSVVDDKLIVPTCEEGSIRMYSLENPGSPQLKWNIKAGAGCIESTPAVWKNHIFVGSRDGFFYKIGEKI